MTSAALTNAPLGPVDAVDAARELGYYRLVWRRFRSRRLALLSILVLATLTVCCFVVPLFLPPEHSDVHIYGPMTLAHPLGTDQEGRDLLRRNLEGGQISLIVGFLAMIVTLVIATALGALSGFFGGVIDSAMTALTNAFLSIPSLLILVIFAKIGRQNVPSIVIGIALVSWPYTARIVRSVVLGLREKDFVEAARALGTPRWRIITRHVLPNALGPLVVAASLTIGSAILTESALSFLGVGIGAPIASWGSLLDDGRAALYGQNDYLYALWPGLCILVTVLSFNYIGDALRDAFDPRSLR